MKIRYEYLLFGLLGEFFGVVYTLKEAAIRIMWLKTPQNG